jgi:hypothetical protein
VCVSILTFPTQEKNLNAEKEIFKEGIKIMEMHYFVISISGKLL